MTIFSIILIATAVTGLLLFSGNMLLMILAAVAGICSIVLPLIRRDLGKMLAGVCIVVGLFFLVLSGTSTSKNGIQAYAKEVDKIQNRIEKGKLDDAREKIGELEETYGVNDTSRRLLAACYQQAEEYDTAISTLEQCSIRGEGWYRLMILCMIATFALVARALQLDRHRVVRQRRAEVAFLDPHGLVRLRVHEVSRAVARHAQAPGHRAGLARRLPFSQLFFSLVHVPSPFGGDVSQKNHLAQASRPCFHGTRCDTPVLPLKESRFATYQS